MENEVWKDVIGYEGLYQVSSLGRVKRLPKKRPNGIVPYISKEKILEPRITAFSTPYIILTKNKKKKCKTICHMVAECFLSYKRVSHKLNIFHKNFNKLDNRVDNLEVLIKE